MKKIILSLFALCAMISLSAQRIDRVEPLCWWTGMKMPLTLLIQGDNLADAQVSVLEPGLSVKGQHNAQSANYLFVDMKVEKPGQYTIQIQKGKKKLKYKYLIHERNQALLNRKSYNTSDVIYLLMPDRFANGDSSNDNMPQCVEQANRGEFYGRHGGDIAGIIKHLDHIANLGATALWSTPLLLDNEPTQSYHGYACADYYHIDPRMGTNEMYRNLADSCHAKGLKLIMDMVPNHCGAAHWWMKDLPYQDWIHQFKTYTQSNWEFTTAMDNNAAPSDRELMVSGWFDTAMPDMNLDNPDLLHYFQQMAIWWIEYAGLDGLRVDTYPYNEKEPISKWTKAIRDEYPNINIVGECWTRPASQICYWQADANNTDGYNSHLPSVMDFPTQEAIVQALQNDGQGWGNGLLKVYESVANDYMYANTNNLLIFSGNHDTERIGDLVLDSNPERMKLAAVMIATLRGIPQLTYGEEIGMLSADKTKGHGSLRRDFPGFFPGDKQQLEPGQQSMLDFYTKLFNWRKTEPIIHNGKTMHFLSRDNTYAYFRYTDRGAVFVYLNASNEVKKIDWKHYNDIASKYSSTGTNVMTGEKIDMAANVEVKPLSFMIVKL